MRLWWDWSEIYQNMDYTLIFWLVSTYLKSVNRNWQPCMLLLLLLHCGIRLCTVKRQRRRLRPFYLSCVFCWQTHYYFSSKFAPNITLIWQVFDDDVCMSISLMDQPRCLRPIQTKVICSKLSRFQSSFRFTRLLKRPKRLHTWGPVFLFWKIIKYYKFNT